MLLEDYDNAVAENMKLEKLMAKEKQMYEKELAIAADLA